MIKPKGTSDALDGTDVAKGLMSSLSNLIPDPTTQDLFIPRPAASQITSFAGFNTPGFISCLFVLGNTAYGLIASNRNPGHDEPFAYDLINNTFIVVTGTINNNTTPVSLDSFVGDAWVPPTMDLISTKIMVTSPGFTSATGNFFGWIDVANPAIPVWHAGNTATNLLPSVPTVVKNFNNRAYFACGNSAYFSDVLAPTTITNANQFLVLGDTTPIVAFSGLPLNSTAGGVVQGLIAFKNTILYQITGDLALMNLVLNAIPSSVGTYAPLSVCSTPEGIAFISPDGLRLVNLIGNVTPPIGVNGEGVSTPFINASVPSRIVATYNVDTLRISVGSSEYWYNTSRKAWTGPHTFPASFIVPYQQSFIMTGVSINAILWKSDIIVNGMSNYIENGTQMIFDYATTLLPSTGIMAENALIETTIGVAFQSGAGQLTITMQNEDGGIINQVLINAPTGTGTFWDQFLWDQADWDASAFGLKQIFIPWSAPVVFDQAIFGITGNSVSGLKIGNLFMRYQPLGYLTQQTL